MAAKEPKITREASFRLTLTFVVTSSTAHTIKKSTTFACSKPRNNFERRYRDPTSDPRNDTQSKSTSPSRPMHIEICKEPIGVVSWKEQSAVTNVCKKDVKRSRARN